MIDKAIEDFLLSQSATFMKPADSVAVLQADHKISHAKLLLSQYKYSRVPVITHEKHYMGVLGLTEIVDFEMNHDFYYEKSQQTPVSEIMVTDVETVPTIYQLEDVLKKLVHEPFLPVLEGPVFKGIIVRQEILKAFNAFIHDFSKDYEISRRNR